VIAKSAKDLTELMDYKHRIRNQFKFYSQDLINNLFTHPYTKIAFIERDLKVSRLTATVIPELLQMLGVVTIDDIPNFEQRAGVIAMLQRYEPIGSVRVSAGTCIRKHLRAWRQ
jgi:hypothetical protein